LNGKVIVALLVFPAIFAGAALYYLQIFSFYEEIVPDGKTDVSILQKENELPEVINYSNFRAISSESSPIRYRACFETSEDLDVLRENYLVYEDAVPKIAPYWFDCFDAKELGLALKDSDYGEVFLSKKNIVYGIDRVVAILANGNGYVWHEINECGDKLYDGSPVSNECPEKD
jgi:hypothetical protein